MDELEDSPMEKPIGSFIIDQEDIKPTFTADGAYYHYSQVCILLNRLKEKLSEEKK